MKHKHVPTWFPLYIDKWLLGSTRHELTHDERAIWMDLMALSKKDQGYIRANKGIPYPLEQLSGMLMSQFDTFEKTLELVTRVIEKCLSPKVAKLKRMLDGTLFVLSHESYLLSDRWERELNKRKSIPNKRKPLPNKRKPSNILSSNIILSSLKEETLTQWNDFASKWELPKISDIKSGSSRERHLLNRMKEKDFTFVGLLQKIEKQPFLLGKNTKKWAITFDWILLPSNYQKVIEETYPERHVRDGNLDSPQVGSTKQFAAAKTRIESMPKEDVPESYKQAREAQKEKP